MEKDIRYTMIFTKVMDHLLKQKVRAIKISGNGSKCCAYRDFGAGTKCAIGSLFPDNEYRTQFESHGVGWLLEHPKCPPTLKSLTFGVSYDFLANLQMLHDEGLQEGNDFRLYFEHVVSRYEQQLDTKTIEIYRDKVKEFKNG